MASATKVQELPYSMKAAQGKGYGEIDEMISVEGGVKVPRLAHLPPEKKKRSNRNDWMVVRTCSVSLAPGDCRVLSGMTRAFQGPPSFPYVPGGDCAGIVVEVPENNDASKSQTFPFRVGDRVAARFVDEGPRGALGQYSLVSAKVAEKIPQGISMDEGAALVSATPATVLADHIRKDDRVLVIGARGGVGAHFCQIIRDRGASLVVGTSRSPEELLREPISCDEAIGYDRQDVFSLEKYTKDKFDVVVDLAGFGYARLEEDIENGRPIIVKTNAAGGRFLTLVPPIGPTYEIRSIWHAIQTFSFPIWHKTLASRTWNRRKLPKYTFAFCLPVTRDCATRTFELAESGKLKAVVDPRGPFPFTTEGAREAFRVQKSRHACGKVIVRVAEERIYRAK